MLLYLSYNLYEASFKNIICLTSASMLYFSEAVSSSGGDMEAKLICMSGHCFGDLAWVFAKIAASNPDPLKYP